MNFRYLLVLLLATLTLLGWTYVHHQYLTSRQFRLDQLPKMPVYAYIYDSAQVDSLYHGLTQQIPEIDSLTHETGHQALIQDFPDTDYKTGGLDEFRLQILSIYFKPIDASFKGRENALEYLKANGLDASNIEAQELAWGLERKELDFLSSRWSNSTLFIAVLVFLMILYARLYIYLAVSAASGGMISTVLENIRDSESSKWQNALLLVLPILLNFGAYHLLGVLDVLVPQIHFSFFLVQFASVLTAVVAAILINNMREPDPRPGAHGITVTRPTEN